MASTRDEIFRFLQRIVGDTLTPEGSKLLVWTAPAKESRWYADLWQAADEASRLSGNVYFGVCLAPDDVCGGKTRATAQQVSYATCLWADIDYVSPHHAKGNLPPSEADAMNCLREAFPPHLQPPVVINSGCKPSGPWPNRWTSHPTSIGPSSPSSCAAGRGSFAQRWNATAGRWTPPTTSPA